MEQPLYRYMATVNAIIDGDTVNLTIEEGFHHSWKVNSRLAGINAPEKNSDDLLLREKAIDSMNYLASLLPVGSQVYIISRKLDKYGRPLSSIYLKGLYINDEMIKKGHAVAY